MNFATIESLIGKRFGRLVVLSKGGVTSNRHRKWICRCDCGTIIHSPTTNKLISGHTNSCGCYQRYKAAAAQEKHGLCNTPTYNSWRGMIGRCYNKTDKSYKWYGGRGISVADEWRTFEGFLSDMGERPDGCSLDRVDFEGNYCKDNCEWILSQKQAQNTRSNVMIESQGETLCIAEWARRLNIPYGTLQSRLKRGISFTRAIEL